MIIITWDKFAVNFIAYFINPSTPANLRQVHVSSVHIIPRFAGQLSRIISVILVRVSLSKHLKF